MLLQTNEVLHDVTSNTLLSTLFHLQSIYVELNNPQKHFEELIRFFFSQIRNSGFILSCWTAHWDFLEELQRLVQSE